MSTEVNLERLVGAHEGLGDIIRAFHPEREGNNVSQQEDNSNAWGPASPPKTTLRSTNKVCHFSVVVVLFITYREVIYFSGKISGMQKGSLPHKYLFS